MKRLQRAALLTELANQLLQGGSWCGETHLQKSAYFLQELLRVPTEFEFMLYKFGPYSFGLCEELTALRADELLELQVRHASYGPALRATPASAELRERYPITLGKYADRLRFVAERIGDKGVAELERLATALYVTRTAPELTTAKARAGRLTELKPHVPFEAALEAVNALDVISQAARAQFEDLEE
jgi:hypothetical protein